MKSDTAQHCVVELTDVSKVFKADGQGTRAVQQIMFKAFLGELVVLLGPSGSGKTTLLTLISGLLQPTAGRIFLFGKQMNEYSRQELQGLRARRVGFIFQTFHLIDALTVFENVMLVLRFAGRPQAEARQRAAELLGMLSIHNLAGRYPTQLSQGQKQRVAVARAMANGADLILADEPTSNLESAQGFEIIRFLHTHAKEENKCVIVASHDLRLVDFADRVIRLEDGRINVRTP